MPSSAVFLHMYRGGMARGDSTFRTHYSDLEYLLASQYGVRDYFCDLQMFAVRSNEGKTNKVCKDGGISEIQLHCLFRMGNTNTI